MSKVSVEPIRILLVEDDEADILLAQRAFTRARIWNTLDVVRNGEQALDYLHNRGPYTDKILHPRPDLMLLDLNMPGIDGREVLRRMAAYTELKKIPVVIISTSDYEKDIEFGRSHGVRHYIIKPLQADSIFETCMAVPGFQLVMGNVIS